jgi:hypothetical protein
MDHTLSSLHRGGRRVRGLIRRWLVPPLIACFVFPAMAAPTPAKSQSAAEHDGDLAIVRGILMLTDSEIDLATAKLTIDRLMDPGVDVQATTHERQGLREQQLKMSRMALDHNPRDVAILLHQHAAWLWFRNLLVNRYVTPDDVPAAERALLARHDTALRDLYERAWSLGWRPPDAAQDEAVRQRAAKAKATQLEKTK